MRTKCFLITLALLSLAMFSALMGCGGGGSGSSSGPSPTTNNLPSRVSEALKNGTPVDSRLVTANNTFGFKLLNELRKADTSQNVTLSPTSIALALQIVYNGAAGDTQQAMDKALQLQGMSLSDLNAANAALQASLVNPDSGVTLQLANSLWMRDTVKPTFVQINKDYYGSELGDVSHLPDSVNQWVAQKTNGRITDLLPQNDYSQTVALIANAVYFKGAWSKKFDATQTQDATFTTRDGSKKSCKLMTQTGFYRFAAGNTYQAVALPYGSKGRLSMIIVLPNAGTDLDTLLDGWDTTQWNTLVGNMLPTDGTVLLPRFTLTLPTQLKSALTALGMGVAFDQSKADLSNLADGAYIRDVFHKTFVQVNEEGTEAAGATGIDIEPTSMPVDVFRMRMDRPFFWAIRDDKTGTILFLGKLADPSVGS